MIGNILGLYRDNGNENGNYHFYDRIYIGVMVGNNGIYHRGIQGGLY